MALAALVLSATLAPASAVASEEPAEAEPTTVTTVLHPGWNMVGWVGPETTASDLFDEIPALTGIYAWDSEAGGYRHRARPIVHLLDPLMLTPGRGLWLYLDGEAPFEWTREASEHSVLLELQAGRNLVAWAGRDGTPIDEAVVRFGERFVRAWRWDAEASRYRLYQPQAAANSLTELNHGDALLIELTEDTRWWQSGTAPPPVVFLGEVGDERRAEIGQSTDSVRAVFAERWGVEAAPTIYVGDRESIAPTYRRIRGYEHPGYCGDGGQVIFLRLSCVGGGSIAHEYFHALQQNLGGDGYGRVPTWIIEGSAVYAAAVYTGFSDPTTGVRAQLDEYLDREARRLIRYEPTSLDRVEGYTEFHGLPDTIGYSVGLIAADWLVEQSSERSMIGFFENLASYDSWEAAFEGAFGIAVEDFYDEFHSDLAEIAPSLPHLTDNSDEPVLVFVGDLPEETEATVRAEFDAVRSHFALGLEAGTADYTLYVGGDRESLLEIYMRVSGNEPPESFCLWLPYSGSAIINLDCTHATYQLGRVHHIAVRELLAPWRALPPVQDGFDRRGPVWVRSGAEAYIPYAYSLGRGYEGLEGSRERRLSSARQTAKLLNSVSTWEGHQEDSSQGAALGFLAVEWLVERGGDTALFEYYRRLPNSDSWEESFEAAFGISIDDFYEAFEAYRALVAPPIEGADSS